MKVSKAQIFYCKLPFAIQTVKVFPLECFAIYSTLPENID